MKQFLPILFIPLFFSSPATSQYLLKINGKVIDKSGSKIEGARLLLFENNAEVNNMLTKKNGKFDFDLSLNREYKLRVSKQSYFSKSYEFNTNIPQGAKPAAGSFWSFPFDIELVSFVEGMEISDKSFANVGYNMNNNKFEYDAVYTDKAKTLMEKSIQQIKDKKAAEAARKAEELANETAAKKAAEAAAAGAAAAQKAEEEKLAKESRDKRKEEELLAKKEEAEKKAEMERLAKEENRRKAGEEEDKRKALAGKAEEEQAKSRAYLISLAEQARTEEEQAIRTEQAAEAFLERKTDDSRSNELREILEQEKKEIIIIELTNYETKTKSKRRFLEEIADSKLNLKKQ